MTELREPVCFNITPKVLLDKALRVYWESELQDRKDKEEVISKTVDKMLKRSILWYDDIEVGVVGIRDWYGKQEIPRVEGDKGIIVGEYITFYLTETKRKWYLRAFTSLENALEEIARVKRGIGVEPVLLRCSEDLAIRLS